MHTFLFGQDRPAVLFPAGTVLWRACFFSGQNFCARLGEVQPSKTNKGSWIFRLNVHGSFFFEPELGNAHYKEWNTYGLVVFLNEELPENWTHLIVTGCSKAMHDPGAEKGKALFAEVAEPYKGYLAFRERLANNGQSLNYNFDQALELSLQHWPEDFKPGQRRLITTLKWGDIGKYIGYNYAHLRIRSAEEIARMNELEPIEEENAECNAQPNS